MPVSASESSTGTVNLSVVGCNLRLFCRVSVVAGYFHISYCPGEKTIVVSVAVAPIDHASWDSSRL